MLRPWSIPPPQIEATPKCRQISTSEPSLRSCYVEARRRDASLRAITCPANSMAIPTWVRVQSSRHCLFVSHGEEHTRSKPRSTGRLIRDGRARDIFHHLPRLDLSDPDRSGTDKTDREDGHHLRGSQAKRGIIQPGAAEVGLRYTTRGDSAVKRGSRRADSQARLLRIIYRQ